MPTGWAGQSAAGTAQGGKSATALQGHTAELTGPLGLMHVHYKSSSACLFTIVLSFLDVFEVVTDPVF